MIKIVSVNSKEKLSDARKTRLDALGFVWDPKDHAWETMFAELKRYKERFGDCEVPDKWNENPQLGIWVGTQRTRQKKGTLSIDRKSRLDEIGFVWDPLEAAWENMFAELKCYADKHGHCNVPAVWRQNPALGSWVHTQRVVNNAGKLSPERRARLDAVGFEWSRRRWTPVLIIF
jgi:hypothetical protein